MFVDDFQIDQMYVHSGATFRIHIVELRAASAEENNMRRFWERGLFVPVLAATMLGLCSLPAVYEMTYSKILELCEVK